MKRRALIAGCIFVAVASLVAACDRIGAWLPPTRCVLSNRPIHPGMAVRIEVEDGGPSGDAFAHREDAERVQKEAGGAIRTFAEFVAGTKVTAKQRGALLPGQSTAAIRKT